MMSKLRQNISLSYIYNFFLQLNITSAIWVLYLAFKGMSLIEIGILESIYHITGLIFEIPTGALADMYGRKFCVVLGRIVCVISCILMITSNSFLEFALAFILSCAAINLNSGAAEALVYDSLKELGEEEDYKRIWGELAFVMSIAQGIAVLLGGILSDIRFLYAYVFGMLVQIAALIISFNFSEPTHIKNRIEKSSDCNDKIKGKKSILSNLIYQIATTINVLKVRKAVLYIIMFYAMADSLRTTVFFYGQQYFSDMCYSKTVIAIICAAGSLIEAVSSKYAYIFEKRFKIKGTLISIAVLNIVALAGLSYIKKLSAAFFLLTSVSGGISFTIFSDYINARIPSEHRATILSFNSLCFSLFMICIFPLFGFLAQNISFSATFGLMALLYIPVMVLLMIKLNDHKV